MPVSRWIDRSAPLRAGWRPAVLGLAVVGSVAACGSSSSSSSPAGSAANLTAACQDQLKINEGFNKLFAGLPHDNTPLTDAQKQQVKSQYTSAGIDRRRTAIAEAMAIEEGGQVVPAALNSTLVRLRSAAVPYLERNKTG